MRKKKKHLIIVAIICIAAFTAIMLNIELIVLAIEFHMENRPAQVEQAEVTGKRTTQHTSGENILTNYYITFKFSDGSVKEFETGRPNVNKSYDAIHEGDTGKITYTVSTRYPNGRFVRFEKGTNEGVLIIEPYRQSGFDVRVLIISTSSMILLILLKIPSINITMNTRKGVTVTYSPLLKMA